MRVKYKRKFIKEIVDFKGKLFIVMVYIIFYIILLSIMDKDKNKILPVNETAVPAEGTDKTGVVQQDISKELINVVAKTPRELADEAAEILYEAFEKDFNLTKEDGRRKYHIARKESIIQLQWSIVPVEGKTILGEGKMIMEVNSKGKLKIRLTTDDGMANYIAEDLSNEDLISAIPAMKIFIADNTNMPSTSKFPKTNKNGNYTVEDMEDRIKNPLQNTK